jgi:hypothetical protein
MHGDSPRCANATPGPACQRDGPSSARQKQT